MWLACLPALTSVPLTRTRQPRVAAGPLQHRAVFGVPTGVRPACSHSGTSRPGQRTACPLAPGPWRPHALLSAPWALPPGLKLPSAPDQTLTLKAEASLCLLTAGPEHSRPMSSARLPRWLRCQQPGPASRPRRPPSARVVR